MRRLITRFCFSDFTISYFWLFAVGILPRTLCKIVKVFLQFVTKFTIRIDFLTTTDVSDNISVCRSDNMRQADFSFCAE